ncbi:MAG: PQQ-binding-like beta-propeller repeat protein [Planctomycetota bacterium]
MTRTQHSRPAKRITSLSFVVPLTIAIASALLTVVRAEGLAPKTETFAGDYKVLRLKIGACWPAGSTEKDKTPKSFTLLAAFRDGVPAGVWLHGVSGTPAAMHLIGRDARLTAESLKGRLVIFSGSGNTSGEATATALELELHIKGADVTGTLAAGGGKPVDAKGVLMTEAELAKTNALAAGKEWPSWQGVDASVRGPASGVELIDSLVRARPVWRSEAVLPVAFGNAADFRYALRAAAQGTCGGASSPVVSSGRVFQYYYQPNGTLDEKAAETTLASAKQPLTEFQKNWVKDMYRDAADDVIVSLDASTGRLLWRTTLPQRTLNLQTHKHRGVNPTPLADGEALYVASYAGRVYRLDAKTGALIWEYPEAATQPYSGARGQGGSGGVPVGCASPIRIGATLAVTIKDQLIGIDMANGKALWKTAAGSDAQLYSWDNGGKPAFLTVGIRRAQKKGDPQPAVVTLVSPVDGKIIWSAEADFNRQYRLPILAGDLLLAYRLGTNDENNISVGEKNSLLAFRLKSTGMEAAWQLKGLPQITDSYGLAAQNGFAYISGESEVWAVSLKDGTIASKVAGTGGARTQVIWSAEDRLFLCPEGRHGTCSLTMLTADGAKMKLLGTEDSAVGAWKGAWHVANPFTTAYANHQIIHPVVDGRLFVRGADGIYCYDLRKE